MSSPRTRFDLLATPLFITSLFVLLLNDFYLKSLIGNWVTGKLSDFSGLLAFSIVCFSVAPKNPYLLSAAITFTFIFWKLPVSDDFFSTLNALGVPLGRTVDTTDLIALSVVPLSLLWCSKQQPRDVTAISLPILLLSCFAFLGTSYIPKLSPEQALELSREEQSWPTYLYSFKPAEGSNKFELHASPTQLNTWLNRNGTLSHMGNSPIESVWSGTIQYALYFNGRSYCEPTPPHEYLKIPEYSVQKAQAPSTSQIERIDFSLKPLRNRSEVTVTYVTWCQQRSESTLSERDILERVENFLRQAHYTER